MINVCNLCKDDFDTSLAHHYMTVHPTEHSYDPIETWPDGKFTYVDASDATSDLNHGGEDET